MLALAMRMCDQKIMVGCHISHRDYLNKKKTKPTIDRELGELQCEYQSTMTRKVSSSKPAGLARIVSQCSWRVATRAS